MVGGNDIYHFIFKGFTMSTNIHFHAERKVQVLETGKIKTERFNIPYAWQTPTEVTKMIMKSSDPTQAYIDWVLSHSKDEQYPVYADDDVLCEREPVRYDTINMAEEYLKWFKPTLDSMKTDGYEIVVEAW
jgi:hypothetical protein